jgi:hypothetical protein
MKEYRPQPSKQPEQHMPQQEGGNGAPGIPPRVHERANPPPERRAYPTLPQKSPLNRAVEGTRDLYERNGWTLVPLFKCPEDPDVRIMREAMNRRGEKFEDILPLILEGLKRFDDSDPKYAEFIRKKIARLGYPTGEHVSEEDLQRMFDLSSPPDEPSSEDKR